MVLITNEKNLNVNEDREKKVDTMQKKVQSFVCVIYICSVLFPLVTLTTFKD